MPAKNGNQCAEMNSFKTTLLEYIYYYIKGAQLLSSVT